MTVAHWGRAHLELGCKRGTWQKYCNRTLKWWWGIDVFRVLDGLHCIDILASGSFIAVCSFTKGFKWRRTVLLKCLKLGLIYDKEHWWGRKSHDMDQNSVLWVGVTTAKNENEQRILKVTGFSFFKIPSENCNLRYPCYTWRMTLPLGNQVGLNDANLTENTILCTY